MLPNKVQKEIEELIIQYDLKKAATLIVEQLEDPAKITVAEYFLQQITRLQDQADKGITPVEELSMEYNKIATRLLELILPPAQVPQLSDATTYYNLANNLFRQENFHEAVKYYSRAVMANPGYYEAYLERGAAKVRLKQIEEGVVDLSISILLAPKQPFGYFNRGMAYLQLEELDKACADWKMVKSLKVDIADQYLEKFCR